VAEGVTDMDTYVVSSESVAHLVIFPPGWMEKLMVRIPGRTWG
jgi:hypothetical protein